MIEIRGGQEQPDPGRTTTAIQQGEAVRTDAQHSTGPSFLIFDGQGRRQDPVARGYRLCGGARGVALSWCVVIDQVGKDLVGTRCCSPAGERAPVSTLDATEQPRIPSAVEAPPESACTSLAAILRHSSEQYHAELQTEQQQLPSESGSMSVKHWWQIVHDAASSSTGTAENGASVRMIALAPSGARARRCAPSPFLRSTASGLSLG